MKKPEPGQNTAVGQETRARAGRGGKEGAFQKACPDWLPSSSSSLRGLIAFLPHGNTHTHTQGHTQAHTASVGLQSPLEKLCHLNSWGH